MCDPTIKTLYPLSSFISLASHVKHAARKKELMVSNCCPNTFFLNKTESWIERNTYSTTISTTTITTTATKQQQEQQQQQQQQNNKNPGDL